MQYLDARRLTGPNLLWNRAGSILDVGCEPGAAEALISLWDTEVRRMLAAVGWGGESTCHRTLTGGVSLAISAPIDALYAATEINEYAWSACDAAFNRAQAPDFDAKAAQIAAAIDAEVNPPLLALEGAAQAHDVSFLWDDDDVSVGLGTGSQTWPFRELPDPDSLDFAAFHDVPAGIVTGTNGKTTTVRLATHILRRAGNSVGTSSTDWIAVNDRIIDRGDWSGPGGARNVLRQTDVDVAVLETARGGLLRRGLGVDRADAALITNIAEDHLGDFGSRSLTELLDIKWIVSRAVERRGVLILNADDPLLVGKSREYGGRLVWFSLDADNRVVEDHVATGGLAYSQSGGDLVRREGADIVTICASRDIPITLGGAATHNVANSLAAAALTDSLGAGLDTIRDGLCSMSQDLNPGRCNVYSLGGFKVLIDFAHNPQAMKALFGMARALPAKRRLLAFGQAGDRPDELIRDLARSAFSIGLDAVLISELANYHRGRGEGEVFRIIRDELIRCGLSEQQIGHHIEETDTLEAALEWAEDGDLVIMLALGESAEITGRLQALAGASPDTSPD